MKSNEQLQKDILAELNWEPMLNTAEIGVIAKDGVVTLTGKVDSYLKKSAAERAAERVTGVEAIAMDIEVKLGDGIRDDSDIATALLNALKWHSSVPNNKVKIEVDNGWVTLLGQVDWLYQKSMAYNCIESLQGVKGIINLITIKPRTDAKVIKENIVKAFERNASIDAANITVDTTGGTVTLKGKVHSLFERKEAEKAAWSAPGVVTVDDEIIIA